MHTVIVFESKQFGSIRTFVEEGRQEPWFDSTDVFQGREAYEQVMAHADFYLTSEPQTQNLLLA